MDPDGPSHMGKRPTGSGGEPSSPNRGASAGVKARHHSTLSHHRGCGTRFNAWIQGCKPVVALRSAIGFSTAGVKHETVLVVHATVCRVGALSADDTSVVPVFTDGPSAPPACCQRGSPARGHCSTAAQLAQRRRPHRATAIPGRARLTGARHLLVHRRRTGFVLVHHLQLQRSDSAQQRVRARRRGAHMQLTDRIGLRLAASCTCLWPVFGLSLA